MTGRFGCPRHPSSDLRPWNSSARSITDTMQLPPDFKEFLQLLHSEGIEYLLVGGYAVGYYGYPRATGDMDIWFATNRTNAEALVRVFRKFGFSAESLSVELFLEERQVIRMGVPPLQIDLLTNASGVDFANSFAQRTLTVIDGVEVNLICLEDLKANKRATGRAKDLNDLEHLGEPDAEAETP